MRDEQKVYTFHEDPGHGWLEVPVAELDELGIRDKITEYSYRSHDGKTAYLEEDCDLYQFIQALIPGGESEPVRRFMRDRVRTVHSEGECFIRALPRYDALCGRMFGGGA